MDVYAIDMEVWGSVYVQANNLAEATLKLEELCPLVVDVHDRRWFSRGDQISLADAFTLFAPVKGQRPVRVAMGSVRAAMRPSVRGEKKYWVRSNRDDHQINGQCVFTVDVLLIATAFVRAESASDADAVFNALDGIPVHLEDGAKWFRLPGLEDPDLRLVISPMFGFVGPWPDLEEYETEDDEVVSSRLPYRLGVGDQGVTEDLVLEEAAVKLKKLLCLDNNTPVNLTDEDLLAITAALQDHLAGKLGV
ncbi:MAG: hypothetical protein V7774_07860 [Pseudorhizobium pelagicum]|uniref:hypothetical protein n=1 Tax=Pseudorhizobium pelagicum TaxID=1509405 RepID=UPI0034616F08